MQEWYSISDLLALRHPSLPTTRRGMIDYAKSGQWDADKNRARQVTGQGGTRAEYHYTLLPPLVQGKIVTDAIISEVQVNDQITREDLLAQSLWHIYHTVADSQREKAQARLDILHQVDDLALSVPMVSAVATIAEKSKTPVRTINRWRKMVAGLPRRDWLAGLVPANRGRTTKAHCDPAAWDMLVGDYLRYSGPQFAACYARMKEAAAAHGWAPIPSKATLLRRIEAEFGPVAITLAREGKAAAERLYPAQQRDRTVFHAMEAVNADGHVFDLFAIWPDGTIARPCLIGYQDLFSGMLLSFRLSRTENKETTRLSTGDMVESWGIPEHVYFDNGRAFMSKWITGGMEHRFRFKIKDEEPRGILTQLGVKVHNVRPYHGQSKPIERAWRDLAENISRHPAMDGAYTGNRPDAKPENYRARAIPIDELREFVAKEMLRHNTRKDRNTQTAKGRSFAEVFQESLANPNTIVRRATELQRQFFMLAGEGKTARSTNGEIHLADNRYWSESLIAYAGKKLMVRFDPENLHDDLYVYTLDGRFIDRAPCIEAEGFNDAEAARRHAALKRRFMKAHREVLELGRLLTPAQVAAQIPDPDPIEMELPKVVGLHTSPSPSVPDLADASAAFGRGLTDAMGVANIFDHPTKTGGK